MDCCVKEIVDALDLTEYFPTKLGYAEATTLRTDGAITSYGLALVGYLLKSDLKQLEKIISEIKEGHKSTDDSCGYQVSVNLESGAAQYKNAVKKKHLNPMDVMAVLFNCCDEILRQILMQKLVSTKSSVPFLLPTLKREESMPMVLGWSLRGIALGSSDCVTEQRYLVDIPNPIISFFRTGKLKTSKSKLLSSFISNKSPPAFFNRECKNYKANRVVSNGSIEVAWFQSSENADDDFQFNSKFFTILNLRGDAKEYPMQTIFLCQSPLLVVIMTNSVESLASLFERVQKEICWDDVHIMIAIVPDDESDLSLEIHSYISTCSFIKNSVDIVCDCNDDERMNSEEWRTCVRNKLAEFIKKHKNEKYFTLKDIFEKVKSYGFQLEDDNEKFRDSIEIANSFVNYVGERISLQPQIFPLQGQPLKKIAELEKRMARRNLNETSSEKPEQVLKSLKHERNMQLTILSELAKPEQTFFETLSRLKGKDFVITATLVKLLLDEKLFLMKLSPLNTMTGLESIVREMGQMFEAEESKYENDLLYIRQQHIRDFPRRAAELLLMGQPLELLNGEASCIPISWIKMVFQNVAELTENGKVFVLSAIGVQSSGKSTLLNFLFGLNFPTSAGRCTRGLFCHLLAIDKRYVKCDCDYVMILDAEGFRAPEFVKTSTERDNEMATFIVGVSDLTIVNIEGENWGEMKDILQIVTYALVRIKQTKHSIELMPRCIFVHQKISDQNFHEKTKEGKAIMLKYLDEMVEKAAKQEGYMNITAFKDVVAYNIEDDSYFLPNIWDGNPPFATISSQYCNSVQKLKRDLVNKIRSRESCLNFLHLYLRISDLWDAILQENFVFSFRDTKSALNYRMLTAACAEIESNFQDDNHKLLAMITNKVSSIEDTNELLRNEENLRMELNEKIKKNFQVTDVAMRETLSKHPDRSVVEMFRAICEKTLETLKNEQNRKTNEAFERIFSSQRRRLETCEDVESKQKQIMVDVLRLRRNSLPDQELLKDIDKMWEEQFSEENKLFQDLLSSSESIIGITIRKYLPQYALAKYQSTHQSSIPEVTNQDIVKNAVKIKKETDEASYYKILPTVAANEACRKLFERCRSSIEALNGLDFEESHVKIVFRLVYDFFGQTITETPDHLQGNPTNDPSKEAAEERDCDGFSHNTNFTKDFIARYFAAIGHHVHDRLCTFGVDFIQKTNAYGVIRNRFHQRIKLVILRRREPEFMLASYILEEVEQAVFQDLHSIVCKRLKEKLFNSKKAFIAKMITDLAKEEDFSEHYKLFTEFDGFYEAFLQNYVRELWNDKAFINELKMRINNKVEEIQNDIRYSLNECKDDPGELLKIFRGKIDGKIAFCTEIALLFYSEINKDETKFKNIQETVNQLQKDIKELSEENDSLVLENSRLYYAKNPIIEICEEISSGCTEKCPFCSAPCLEETRDHTPHIKHHSLHYPLGLRGTVKKSGRLHDAGSSGKRFSLVLKRCPSLVQSNKHFRSDYTIQRYSRWYHKLFRLDCIRYKDFQKYFPDWEIPILLRQTKKDKDYWRWIMAKFGGDFAEKYGVASPNIKNKWYQIKRDMAVNGICSTLNQ